MKEESLRLFIALNMNPRARGEIVRLQTRLWGAGQRGLTRPENLHLTLAFLGQTAPNKVDAVRQAMDRAGAQKLELVFDRVGVFRRTGGDIWWLGMRDDPELFALQSRLTRELRRAEFPLEERKFVAHLTLARRAEPRCDPPGRLDRPIHARVAAVSLMRSQRVDGKLIYTQLYAAT